MDVFSTCSQWESELISDTSYRPVYLPDESNCCYLSSNLFSHSRWSWRHYTPNKLAGALSLECPSVSTYDSQLLFPSIVHVIPNGQRLWYDDDDDDLLFKLWVFILFIKYAYSMFSPWGAYLQSCKAHPHPLFNLENMDIFTFGVPNL